MQKTKLTTDKGLMEQISESTRREYTQMTAQEFEKAMNMKEYISYQSYVYTNWESINAYYSNYYNKKSIPTYDSIIEFLNNKQSK